MKYCAILCEIYKIMQKCAILCGNDKIVRFYRILCGNGQIVRNRTDRTKSLPLLDDLSGQLVNGHALVKSFIFLFSKVIHVADWSVIITLFTDYIIDLFCL